MADHQTTHAPGCWDWGPRHYECALREIETLRADLDGFHDLRKRAETSWQRGFQQGLESNRLLATQAMDALKKEREAHAETNRAMTDALLMMEEREQRDEALLRQALEALKGMEKWASSVYDGYPPSTASIAAAPYREAARAAIAALRERLGEKA